MNDWSRFETGDWANSPVPTHAAERLNALRLYKILDTPPEQDFDNVAALAAAICGTPMALISLIDADRQWFKAAFGLDAKEMSRDVAFGAHAIMGPDLFVVPDATLDTRFAEYPLVTRDPKIRFYAGAPLITADGHALGTLCVIDQVPRTLTAEQEDALRVLSAQVVSQLELRRTRTDLELFRTEAATKADELRKSEEFKSRLIACSRDCIKVLDLDGKLTFMNEGGMQVLEICDLGPILGNPWIDFWEGDDREAARVAVEAARNGGTGRFVGYFPTTQTSKPRWWDVVVSPICDAQGKPESLLALSRDVTERHLSEETLRSIVIGTASATGSDFFPSLVRHMARALQVRYAFITECNDQKHARTLAVWTGEGFGDNFEFDIAGTPCMKVLTGEVCHYEEGLQALFPDDKGLVDWQAESYLGVPMTDRVGCVMGHIAILDDKPMERDTRAIDLVRIFASRATAELKRQRAETELQAALQQVQELQKKLEAENVYLQEEISREHNFEEIVGNSPVLLEVLRQVETVAATDSTVMILGETGCGKELIARAVHSHSARKNRPLGKVNCGAIPNGLVESELFGHMKGAFTGALERRTGRFELADGGTLFLDEVSELPLETQVKLLRVLQEHEFEPLGSSRTMRVNVRIIAATNRDLEKAVQEGRFRADLYYRLNVLPMVLPPLRQRRSDIPLLTAFFVDRFCRQFGKQIAGVAQETMELLSRYEWPGNIRELQNVIERAVVLSRGPVLRLGGDLLPNTSAECASDKSHEHAAAQAGQTVETDSGTLPSLEDVEKRHILEMLKHTRGVIEGGRGAAVILAMHPNTLRSRMKKLGIERPAM
jgi:PAS domain S-box-containing protein